MYVSMRYHIVRKNCNFEVCKMSMNHLMVVYKPIIFLYKKGRLYDKTFLKIN